MGKFWLTRRIISFRLCKQMPYKPGESGNPSGRPRRSISQVVRKQEFRRSFLHLMRIRDGRVRELDFDEDGNKIWVYPSVQHLIQACVKIMEYTAGKPEQKISLDVIGDAEKPNALQLVLNAHEGSVHDERPRLILTSGQDGPNYVKQIEPKAEDPKPESDKSVLEP